MRKRFYLFGTLLFCSVAGFAQDMKKIEKELYGYVKDIQQWSSYTNSLLSASDSLDKFNGLLHHKLVSYCSQYPEMVSYHFKSFDSDTSGLTVLTSDDKLFRIYNWDTQSGGTMHFFNSVFAYKSGEGSKAYFEPDTTVDGDPSYAYNNLYTLAANGKTYYMIVYFGRYSSKDFSEGIKVLAIENGRMDDTVKLIKTRSGMHSSLSYSFDAMASTGLDNGRHDTYFDKNTNTIYIPVVLEGGKMTNKFIKYKFTGEYFEKEGK